MKCERCGENEANIYIKHIFDGEAYEENICEECAEKDQFSFLGDMSKSIKDFYMDTIMSGLNYVPIVQKDDQDEFKKKCSNCGTTYEDFKTGGFWGCSHCYETFRDEITDILKKINESAVHQGKIPVRFRESENSRVEVEQKEKELRVAIESENYEYAAVLRDEIKKLRNKE